MTVNLTGDIADLLGVDFDPRRTKVWIETNIDGDVIIDAVGNTIRLGDAKADVGQDGTFVFTGLTPTDAATNPTGFQYRVWVDYATRRPGGPRARWGTGWFSLTTDMDVADVVAEQYVPPTFLSAATETLQGYVDEGKAYRDQQAAIAGLTGEDAAVANLLGDDVTPSQTRTVLDSVIADLGLGNSATRDVGTAPGDVAAGDRALPLGGVGGQVLAKATSADYDTEWVDPPSGGGIAAPIARVRRNSGAAASYSTTATSAVDVDAANLAITFTVPASGAVRVVLDGRSTVTAGSLFWSLRNGTANVPGTQRFVRNSSTIGGARVQVALSGLIPGSTVTYKWAWMSNGGTGRMDYGGSSSEFVGTCFGPLVMEVWSE